MLRVFLFCQLSFCTYAQPVQCINNLDSLLSSINSTPLVFRAYIKQAFNMQFINTKTFESGTIAEDHFMNANVTIIKRYGFNTILACHGEGLNGMEYLKDFASIEEHKKMWGTRTYCDWSSITLEHVTDSLAQAMKTEAIKIGALESYTCVLPVISDGDHKMYCINGLYNIVFISHRTAEGLYHDIRISCR